MKMMHGETDNSISEINGKASFNRFLSISLLVKEMEIKWLDV